jgi:hypothetical protein
LRRNEKFINDVISGPKCYKQIIESAWCNINNTEFPKKQEKDAEFLKFFNTLTAMLNNFMDLSKHCNKPIT